MAARRILAISPDEALRAQLATALGDLGHEVSAHPTAALPPEALADVALCVAHAPGEIASLATRLLPRLPDACRVIVLLPRANLASVVGLMQASPLVAGTLVAEDFAPAALTTLAARLLGGDLFGLAHVMPAGTEIQTREVHDYHERAACLGQVAALLVRLRLPKAFHTGIEQCLDEMLMNALYDAPVDAAGEAIFAGVPTRTRVGLTIAQTAIVQWAFDGRRFALSVRDAYGSLERATVLRVLHKCLHADDKIDRKAGGAGVGLYLMVNASTALAFNVIPGLATEAVCVFDTQATERRLEQFGFYAVDADVTRTLVSGRRPRAEMTPVPLRRPGHARRVALIAAGAIAVAGVLGGVAWRTLGQAPPDRRPALLAVASQPPGARLTVDGQPAGETPVELSLPPGRAVTLGFHLPGYRDATARVTVPARGATATHTERLALAPDAVRVRLVSTPPGARVIREGSAATSGSRTYTPVEVIVQAGQEQRFTLTMPGHAPLVIPPFTPVAGSPPLEKGGAMTPLPAPAEGDDAGAGD